MVKTDPTASLSAIQTLLYLTKCLVWRIIWKTICFNPYKPQTVQALNSERKMARKNFCEWFLEQPEHFHKRALW